MNEFESASVVRGSWVRGGSGLGEELAAMLIALGANGAALPGGLFSFTALGCVAEEVTRAVLLTIVVVDSFGALDGRALSL